MNFYLEWIRIKCHTVINYNRMCILAEWSEHWTNKKNSKASSETSVSVRVRIRSKVNDKDIYSVVNVT